MRLITYQEVAETIAAAETEDDRRRARALLATYYRGPAGRESALERMAILWNALNEDLRTGHDVPPEESAR